MLRFFGFRWLHCFNWRFFVAGILIQLLFLTVSVRVVLANVENIEGPGELSQPNTIDTGESDRLNSAPSLPSDPVFRNCSIRIVEDQLNQLPGVTAESGQRVEVIFEEFGQPSSNGENAIAAVKRDILGWKVFSRCLHLILESGVRLPVTLLQTRHAGDWQIHSRVHYNPSNGILVSSYRFMADNTLAGAGREEVRGVDEHVLQLLSSGLFGQVNAMRLKSIASGEGILSHETIWRLLP
ncbi:MAG: hypothetical protein CVV64_04385 [Candidatus Wallbacteria bacterium HGW-Wallbacteria-1]|jgi:hypothetical protein|uniref:Uncharacterized protein n=1 Tax=Candidatus Wallbacteria bacterium HGW-Wallbacteria-1 TaxID=2013854 RepID=A0A2N1PRP4_9BACT|nr:MAG: hypothetical protein CVV64_04385 [Candidatus Wallbacteria bacterium HGW-Wallbacteria-1]